MIDHLFVNVLWKDELETVHILGLTYLDEGVVPALAHGAPDDLHLVPNKAFVSYCYSATGSFRAVTFLSPGAFRHDFKGGSPRFISIIRGAVCYHHYEAAKSITKFDELEYGGLNIRLEKVFKRGLKGEGRK